MIGLAVGDLESQFRYHTVNHLSYNVLETHVLQVKLRGKKLGDFFKMLFFSESGKEKQLLFFFLLLTVHW